MNDVTMVQVDKPNVRVYRAFIMLIAGLCFLLGAATAGTWWSLMLFIPLMGIGFLVDAVANIKVSVTYGPNMEDED